MAQAQTRQAWGHTSTLLALIANCHRDPRKQKRPFKASDFDPTRQPSEHDGPRPTVGVEILKQVFLNNRTSTPSSKEHRL